MRINVRILDIKRIKKRERKTGIVLNLVLDLILILGYVEI